uniref:50S ribosomal protein L24, chloroplastic n=1 Tax=Eustigmatophyceae sp. Ndem 8/9T-3m6.8 TaxID=2506146 RepID=A0A3R5QL66_9STRA|nr:plastid ribosomal protein L26 [Eustigmatophyceae sp. Ndem 8/9T-3m6.8]
MGRLWSLLVVGAAASLPYFCAGFIQPAPLPSTLCRPETRANNVVMAAQKMEKNTRRNTEKYIDGPGMPARTEARSKRRWRQHARRRTSLLRFLNAPLHVRRVMMSSPLSKDLKGQYDGVRAMPIRTGDEVKVMKGDHKGKTGKVEGINRAKLYIHIEGITREKAGAKEAGKTSTTIPVNIRASKVQIISLKLDKSREAILKRKADGRWKHLEWMYASYFKKMDDADKEAYNALPSRAEKLKKLRSLRDAPFVVTEAEYAELMKPVEISTELPERTKVKEVAERARTRSRGRK